jgi:hypothetical protein
MDITSIFWAIWIGSFGVSALALASRARRNSKSNR